jgi:hypothetical protein
MTRVVLFASDKGDVPANLAFTNNFAATTNPGVSNDTTQGYQPGSTWINSTAGSVWECISSAKGAAVWVEFAASSGEITDTSASYSASASAVSFTATPAQISGGSAIAVLDLTGAPAAAENLTLPTVAALVAALPGAAIGDSWILRVKNTGDTSAWTVLTNTGWTLNGIVAVAQGFRDFVVTLTSLTTATLQNVGSGAL